MVQVETNECWWLSPVIIGLIITVDQPVSVTWQTYWDKKALLQCPKSWRVTSLPCSDAPECRTRTDYSEWCEHWTAKYPPSLEQQLDLARSAPLSVPVLKRSAPHSTAPPFFWGPLRCVPTDIQPFPLPFPLGLRFAHITYAFFWGGAPFIRRQEAKLSLG